MKKILALLLVLAAYTAQAQTKDVTVRFNGGYGSILDSVEISGVRYYPGSLIKVPRITAAVKVYVTLDNNEEGATIVYLYTEDGIVTLYLDNPHLHMGSRSTTGTFSPLDLNRLISIVLIDNIKP